MIFDTGSSKDNEVQIEEGFWKGKLEIWKGTREEIGKMKQDTRRRWWKEPEEGGAKEEGTRRWWKRNKQKEVQKRNKTRRCNHQDEGGRLLTLLVIPFMFFGEAFGRAAVSP